MLSSSTFGGKMADELPTSSPPGRSIPTRHHLRAAIRVARVITSPGATITAVHQAYIETPTGGIFHHQELLAAERWLVALGLVAKEQGTLRPSERLVELLKLSEAEMCQALVAILIDQEPPLWLPAAARDGELRTELIPDQEAGALADLIPDLARREALLLALARRHDGDALAALGELGEDHVVAACREELTARGRDDLAEKVRRVSLISDQLGWDVDVPNLAGDMQHLEVKTARSRGPRYSVYLSRNETRVGLQDPDWALVICRADANDQVTVVGWCHADALDALLPADRNERGRWESVRLGIDEELLTSGLPPLESG